jgi:hypothetical protein
MADDEIEYISVVQAVKLITKSFNGNPRDLSEFFEGVESARQVVNPIHHPLLLKFIEAKITGEAKNKLLARTERNTWEQIRAILEENYSVKRTLEYYAGILFTSRQGNNESVAQWGSRIDSMGIDLMKEAKARIEKINPSAIEGGAILVSEFMKGSFVAGLRDDKVKYIVKAKGEEESLAQLVETALQEESEIKSQRFKGNPGIATWQNTGYSGSMRSTHRPLIKREVNVTSIKCYRCQGMGHIARNCSEKPACEKCHRIGHETRACRVRDSQGNNSERPTCTKCHKVGHVMRDCRDGSSQGNLW